MSDAFLKNLDIQLNWIRKNGEYSFGEEFNHQQPNHLCYKPCCWNISAFEIQVDGKIRFLEIIKGVQMDLSQRKGNPGTARKIYKDEWIMQSGNQCMDFSDGN